MRDLPVGIRSNKMVDRTGAMEEVLLRDPGGRGVRALAVPGDLGAAAAALAAAGRVVLLTGFPVVMASAGLDGASETDGPYGTAALARWLEAAGKDVRVVVDAPHAGVMRACLAASGCGGARCALDVWPLGEDAARSAGRAGELAGWADHVVAIERAGPCGDGRARNMRGVDVSAHTAPLHLVVEAAAGRADRVGTTAVGDGGNEVGMGKVAGAVRGAVKHGDRIACGVATDNLIAAGVSNWGGYALALAAHLESGGTAPGSLPSEESEAAVWRAGAAAGAVDGVSGERGAMTVDGFPFDLHAGVLRDLRRAALG